jgi:Predicted periplasmic protein
MISGVALLILANTPVRAQTAEEQEKGYRREAMEQALQTKQQFDLYGLRFDVDKATIQPASKKLLDDIATALKNFPDWHLRIVGHTDSTGDPAHNVSLSLDRAIAIKAALVERGVDPQRLVTAGLGENVSVASNATPDGRALNRRVELVRLTDSAEAKKMLKAMSDFLAAQKSLSVGFDTVFEVVTPTDQKLGLASSGTATLVRPDKIRVTRSGGFADFEILYDGKALTLLGKNANLYTQVAAPGTVDQLIDDLQNKYNRPLPGADLLMINSYDELMQDVYDSKDLGSGVIN